MGICSPFTLLLFIDSIDIIVKNFKMAKLSVELNRYFFEEERAEKVTLSDILTLTGERVFGFLLVILSLPSALPVPASWLLYSFWDCDVFLGNTASYRTRSPLAAR